MGIIGSMVKFRIARKVGRMVMDYMKSDKGDSSSNKETPTNENENRM